MIRSILVLQDGDSELKKITRKILVIVAPHGSHAHNVAELISKEIRKRGMWKPDFYLQFPKDFTQSTFNLCDYMKAEGTTVHYLNPNGKEFKRLEK